MGQARWLAGCMGRAAVEGRRGGGGVCGVWGGVPETMVLLILLDLFYFVSTTFMIIIICFPVFFYFMKNSPFLIERH